MQRPAYNNPPPAHSPPLHHPVPQHVSTVPQLRSPPPPVSQQQSNQYGYAPQPGQQNAGGWNAAAGGVGGMPQFGGFINDQTAQMGFQIGSQVLGGGQEYVEKNVSIESSDVALLFATHLRKLLHRHDRKEYIR